jgi:diguanylate cyclase (GGDEF)-like protein
MPLASAGTPLWRRIVILFLLVSLLGLGITSAAFLYFRDRVINYVVTHHMEDVAETSFNTFYQVMRRGWNEQVIHDLISSTNAMDPNLQVDLYRGPLVKAQFGPDPIEHSPDAAVRQALAGREVTRIDRGDHMGRIVKPVTAREECLQCHTNVVPGDVQGAVEVRYDFAGLAGVLEQAVRWSGVAVAAIIALMLATLYAGIRRAAVTPLHRLSAALREAGTQGSVLARVPEEAASSRELDEVVAAFNGVMDRLQAATVSKEVIDAEAQVLRSLVANADRILDRETFARGLLAALGKRFPFRALVVADTRDGRVVLRVFSALDGPDAQAHPLVQGTLAQIRHMLADWIGEQEPEVELNHLAFADDPEQESQPVAVRVGSKEVGGVVQCVTRETTEDELAVLEPLLQTLALGIHVSDRLEGAVKELKHLSHRDSLTGLFNRRSFEEFLHYEFERTRRKPACFSLIMADLDHFKSINDTYGHQVGDEVIAFTATLLAQHTRKADVVARWGGEEFVILLPDTELEGALSLADELRRTLEASTYEVEGVRVHATLSLGVAAFPDHGGNPEKLMAEVDSALYAAKDSGRNRVVRVDEGGGRLVESETNRAILDGLREERLVPHYQPIVEVASGKVYGYEVLARMQDPDGEGLIPAGRFIQVAQRYGFEPQVDRGMARALRADMDARRVPEGPLFFNVSPRNLESPKDLESLLGLLGEGGGTSGYRVTLEITEREALDHQEVIEPQLALLRGAGMRLALDDFGSGYSNFQNLIRLPLAFLKIDGSLVRSIATDVRYRNLVGSIAELGRSLELPTIAEFVEDGETLALLAELGVTHAQGFYLGRPGPAPAGGQPARMGNAPA